MHAMSNRAVEFWISKITKNNDVKFDDMVPNIEISRDEAWGKLDKDVQEAIADSDIGIYSYTFFRGEAFAIDSVRAANCLSSVGDWMKKPETAKATKKDDSKKAEKA